MNENGHILAIDSISKRFGGLQAVNNVSFTVPAGAIKALIGPNGAGKTTLFNLVSGVVTPDTGTITFDGKAANGSRPHQMARLGMARTFQHIRLFPKMSVLQNVMTGRHIHSKTGFIGGMLGLPHTKSEERRIREKCREILDFLTLSDFTDREATSLAYGQQRMVEIGRALACEPKLLLLDEPAAGLNMRETEEMADLITRIRDLGIAVLLVEHDMGLVMNISDEVVVLCYGEKIADDKPVAIQENPEVIRIYLGDDDA